MGVANSKRIYGPEKPDEMGTAGPGAEGGPGAEDAKGEGGPEENNIDKKKKDNMKVWKSFLQEVFKLPDIQKKVKMFDLTSKIPGKNPPEDGEYIAQKIFASKGDVSDFINPSKTYEKELMEYVDKQLLFDEKIKAAATKMADDTTTLLSGKPMKKLKKEYKDKKDDPDVALIYDSVMKALNAAKKHTALYEVLTFMKDEKKFYKMFKAMHISTTDEAAAAGKDKKAEPAAAEGAPAEGAEGDKKEKAPAGDKKEDKAAEPAAAAAEGGSLDSLSMSGGSYDSGTSYGGDRMSMSGSSIDSTNYGGGEEDEAEEEDEEEDEAEEEQDGGSDTSGSEISDDEYETEGGGLFKTPEEKLAAAEKKADKTAYKDKKKELKGDFKTKQNEFMEDIIEYNKFIDANKAILLPIYSKSRIGKNIKKNAPEIEPAMKALITAMNSYEKKEDTTGAAGKTDEPAPGAAGPGAAGPGAAGPGAEAGKEAGKEGAEAGKEAGKEGAEAEAGKEAGKEGAAPPGDGAEKPKDGAANPPPADKKGADEPIQQSGGGAIQPRKKKFTRKKPQKINIRINVGNNNAICESDSSSSSDSCSSSDEEEDTNKTVILHNSNKKRTRRIKSTA